MYSFSKFEHDWIMPERRYIEPLSEEYRVFVNGKEIPVYTCRISRYPFNRLWPGYQRAIEQTMLASFVNIISDEKVNIKIVPNNYCENIKISPLSKEIKYEKNSSGFSLWADTGSQLVVNAENGLAPLYIFSSQPVEDSGSEEATYYFGPGVHFPGKITLSDNESVYIDKDALVFGCVYAENAENIKIFGNGILDDSGEERFCRQGYEPYTNGNVKFYDCKNLKIEGVLMRNSAMWCVNFFHCIDVVADNIKVFGQWRYNTDGIDIVNSQNVIIKNSFVHSFDDTITIKGIDRYSETSNVNITADNCVLLCDWGRCCEVGIETECYEYKNIVFRNCDVVKISAAALDIQNGDCAVIHGVRFENINIELQSNALPEVYQCSDEQVYDAAEIAARPYLIFADNHKYRDKHKENFAATYDVIYKNICIYAEKGAPIPRLRIASLTPEVKQKGFVIDGLYINGRKIARLDEMDCCIENAEDIELR